MTSYNTNVQLTVIQIQLPMLGQYIYMRYKKLHFCQIFKLTISLLFCKIPVKLANNLHKDKSIYPNVYARRSNIWIA